MNTIASPRSIGSRFTSAAVLALAVAGCASTHPPPSTMQGVAAQGPMPVPVLTTSLYGKDATGGLSEADLQRILESPIDLELPARVGVVPLATPFDPKENASLATRAIASHDLAAGLVGAPYFVQVSDISTDLPNVGGIEGLRILAARYRIRYLVLYSERYEDDTHLNGWAWLYPTVVGMFFVPGVTVESHGIAQADLLDVRTGTILFSVMQPVHVKSKELMIGSGIAHKEGRAEATSAAAKVLAKLVIERTHDIVVAAEQGQKKKTLIVPAPITNNTTTTTTNTPNANTAANGN